MLGRQHVLKPIGPTGQIEAGFFGYVRRVVVQNDPDRAIRRIVVVKILEERNKFAASVPPFDASCDMAFMEIQRGKNGTGAKPLVFMIAAHVGMLARDRSQIGGCIGDGLQAWFFIDGNSNDGFDVAVLGSEGCFSFSRPRRSSVTVAPHSPDSKWRWP